MTTVSWLELLIFVAVAVGALMYHFGHAIGREQQKLHTEARQASMRRHPSSGNR